MNIICKEKECLHWELGECKLTRASAPQHESTKCIYYKKRDV